MSAQSVPLDLSVRWNHGARFAKRCTDPPIQVHPLEENTIVLRQSKGVHYEAPFLYLLFGEQRALLLDSGATADPLLFPLRKVVDNLCARWLTLNPRADYELVVAHTHAHRDHVAADRQFLDRPRTTVVGTSPDEVAQYFRLTERTEEVGFDLGDRDLRILAVPGHDPSSIAIYDPRTRLLLTGDTVYPGRLYVQDFPAFQDSLARLVAFAESHSIIHVAGGHVEMTDKPGRDYPLGSTYQPREVAPWMSVHQLHAVYEAALQVAHLPGAHQFADFAIFNGPCERARAAQRARTLVRRLWPLPLR